MRLTEFIINDFLINSDTGEIHKGDDHESIAQKLGYESALQAMKDGYIRVKKGWGQSVYNFVATDQAIKIVKQQVMKDNESSDEDSLQSWVIEYSILNSQGEVIENDGREFDNYIATLAYLTKIQRDL